MSATRTTLAALLLGATCLTAVSADAQTLRWARVGDALTMDPHAQNEGPTHTLNHQIYETLISRDQAGEMVGVLATDWRIDPEDPNSWIFDLREGVTFHNGNPFNADDVVFSIERATSPTSDMKGLHSTVTGAEKIDDYTVRIVSSGPNPLLPNNLTNTFIMDEEWSVENDVVEPQNYAEGEETYAVRNANGTGPYTLESREAEVRTVLRRNENYWGLDQFPVGAAEIVYTPITEAATRVAALLSGEVDFVQDVPVQDIERLSSESGLRVNLGAENRVIFFGMDVGSEDLATDDVEGANPFADVRVRQAMNMAINRDAIQRVVMRGQSMPAGIISPPFVNGWTEALDEYPAADIEAARALMEEAGYGDGFTATMHCPNDRYLNDEAICQAAVSAFGQIGIDVNLVSQSRSLHFPLLQREPPETDLYLLGWGVPTFDSEYIFSFLYHTRDGGSYGTWNPTGYSNPEVDEMIKSLASNTDIDARNETIADIWEILKDETIYIPVHTQMLSYAMSDEIDIPVDAENQPKMKYVEMPQP
ncbi:ABC transporter substrate-binding protein [Salinarimonas ramus]|uniref:Peptide ABC transporter substrate-binding protein n=1 Tax=Salinarimonas ramus TaxID=690164 RepID=A0A917QCT5_9HYPH|nr:ABC transporter substrate-binding protein [Salinarimonas ramus]GGK41535.1 peptide ABC transporter substrate-binding protein [Salinarimonas ramus]